ncbi:hypothetical protein BGZ65_009820, partial [Modicella reniformis]
MEEKKHISEKWYSFVQSYRELLGGFKANPPMSDFENANNLPRQTVKRLITKYDIMCKMPKGSMSVRYNLRGNIREFYPVEIVLEFL